MPQHIHVNGFEMATPGHINHGLWRVPGTAPIDASSGEQNRHRLSRAGNRRMNHT